MIKILIVDDEKGVTDSLKEFFESRDFAAYGAYDGQSALDLVKKENPDIVFLDVKMSGIGGLEVLAEIKKRNKDTSVIMISGFEEKRVINEAMTLGADEYVTKPFRVGYLNDVVIKKVQEIVKRKAEGGA